MVAAGTGRAARILEGALVCARRSEGDRGGGVDGSGGGVDGGGGEKPSAGAGGNGGGGVGGGGVGGGGAGSPSPPQANFFRRASQVKRRWSVKNPLGGLGGGGESGGGEGGGGLGG